MRRTCLLLIAVLCVLPVPVALAVPSALASQEGGSPPYASRVVSYSPKDVVSLRTQVRFTTLIVLPVSEQILEVTCGDKELWLVNANQHLASVKPAKPGSQTNLNLLTTSGAVYSFVLTEVSAMPGVRPDVKVYLELSDESRATPAAKRPLFVSAQQVEEFRVQAALARDEARRAKEQARASDEAAGRAAGEAAATIEKATAAFRATYPTQLQFTYDVKLGRPPFFIRAIFHDGTRTFIQAGARELPALYELNESGPNLIPFEFHDGTYVVPKLLDYGYLAIGKARLFFKRLR
jgi:type IV secretion system protein VirB9